MNDPDRLVAWFGREYFAASIARPGWRVFVHSYHDPQLFTWNDIVSLCGQAPDVLVLGDRSHPPPFLGLESYPCLTVFYSVDSHIHSWHPLYAQAFDACLAGLKDDLDRFAVGRLTAKQVLWSPAYAPNQEYLLWTPEEPEWDVLFAGTVNPETTPLRAEFLERLKSALPGLHVRQGEFKYLFPKARVVLNVAERGDLNFRVFEALAMKKPLLTPLTGNGLLELFEDGRDLLTYAADDAADCAAKARWLLDHPAQAEQMARSGLAKVDSAHRGTHRADACVAFFASLLSQGNGKRLALAGDIHQSVLKPLHLHWADSSAEPAMKMAYLRDARRNLEKHLPDGNGSTV
ncbi:MAG: glycosyltransferase family 1 protein [Desulfovibrio sp.]|nr:glycosyltransferase family 1 protein [Desulfovibrio sp.]MBI4959593.1 glycosyltransferase family 1 protein [Desulfovibrio sp.]